MVCMKRRLFEAFWLASGEVGYCGTPQLHHRSQMAHKLKSIQIHVLLDKGDPGNGSWFGSPQVLWQSSSLGTFEETKQLGPESGLVISGQAGSGG